MKASKRLQQIYNNDIKNSKQYRPMMSSEDLKKYAMIVAKDPTAVKQIETTIKNLDLILAHVDMYMKTK